MLARKPARPMACAAKRAAQKGLGPAAGGAGSGEQSRTRNRALEDDGDVEDAAGGRRRGCGDGGREVERGGVRREGESAERVMNVRQGQVFLLLMLTSTPLRPVCSPPGKQRNVNPPRRPLLPGYEHTKAWSERRVQVLSLGLWPFALATSRASGAAAGVTTAGAPSPGLSRASERALAGIICKFHRARAAHRRAGDVPEHRHRRRARAAHG
jgi:hypothetical protein